MATTLVEYVRLVAPTGDSYGSPHLFRVILDGAPAFSVVLKVTNTVAAELASPLPLPTGTEFAEMLQAILIERGAELVGRVFVEDRGRFQACVSEGGDHELKISTYKHKRWLASALEAYLGP